MDASVVQCDTVAMQVWGSSKAWEPATSFALFMFHVIAPGQQFATLGQVGMFQAMATPLP